MRDLDFGKILCFCLCLCLCLCLHITCIALSSSQCPSRLFIIVYVVSINQKSSEISCICLYNIFFFHAFRHGNKGTTFCCLILIFLIKIILFFLNLKSLLHEKLKMEGKSGFWFSCVPRDLFRFYENFMYIVHCTLYIVQRWFSHQFYLSPSIIVSLSWVFYRLCCLCCQHHQLKLYFKAK